MKTLIAPQLNPLSPPSNGGVNKQRYSSETEEEEEEEGYGEEEGRDGGGSGSGGGEEKFDPTQNEISPPPSLNIPPIIRLFNGANLDIDIPLHLSRLADLSPPQQLIVYSLSFISSLCSLINYIFPLFLSLLLLFFSSSSSLYLSISLHYLSILYISLSPSPSDIHTPRRIPAIQHSTHSTPLRHPLLPRPSTPD